LTGYVTLSQAARGNATLHLDRECPMLHKMAVIAICGVKDITLKKCPRCHPPTDRKVMARKYSEKRKERMSEQL
jgi:hypothetical protein